MNEVVEADEISQRLQQFIISGDLSKLEPSEFVRYYREACRRIGVNWITKPFDFLRLNGKLVLYLNKGGADQLRKVHKISQIGRASCRERVCLYV